MTETTVTCDRCGELIEADRVKLVVQTGKLRAGYADHATGWTCIDLCAECAVVVADCISASQKPPEDLA
jgi:hypothetical protein